MKKVALICAIALTVASAGQKNCMCVTTDTNGNCISVVCN